MKSNRRNISFAVMFLMVVSAFAFTPSASGEASISISVEGFLDDRSFASVNGTATYLVNVNNDGSEDFTDASLRVSFDDSSWKSDNVTMEYSTLNGTGLIAISTLNQGETASIYVNVTVGYGANVAEQTISMDLIFNDGTDDYEGAEALITVTDWVAYESNFPASAAVQTYNNGDQHDYSITIDNIKVDNSSAAQDIDDKIRLSLTTSGWSVRSYDANWTNASGELVLEGMSAGESYDFSFSINLTGNPLAGDDDLSFFATSGGDGGGMMGGEPPYIQPNGLLGIPVIVAERYGVSVSGAGSRNVDLSDGDSTVTWSVKVTNLGNTQDTFALAWDQAGVPSGWDVTALPTTTGLLNTGSEGYKIIDVALTVPSDALATVFNSTSQAMFSLIATSSDGSTSSSQSFTVTVDQIYGVSLDVNNVTKQGVPSEDVDFIFSLSNTGNGEDTFSINVTGASFWAPTLSETNITVAAVSTKTFTLTATVPVNRNVGDDQEFVVAALSSDGTATVNSTVKIITSQVYNIKIEYYTGFNGTATVSQATNLDIRLNITNNGNGVDDLTLSLKDAPSWSVLKSGVDSPIRIIPGGTETVVITLSPTIEDLSGVDYIFQVDAESSNGDQWSSPQLSITMEVKETAGEEVVVEELKDDEDSPGFSILISLLSLTLIVLSRRKD